MPQGIVDQDGELQLGSDKTVRASASRAFASAVNSRCHWRFVADTQISLVSAFRKKWNGVDKDTTRWTRGCRDTLNIFRLFAREPSMSATIALHVASRRRLDPVHLSMSAGVALTV